MDGDAEFKLTEAGMWLQGEVQAKNPDLPRA